MSLGLDTINSFFDDNYDERTRLNVRFSDVFCKGTMDVEFLSALKELEGFVDPIITISSLLQMRRNFNRKWKKNGSGQQKIIEGSPGADKRHHNVLPREIATDIVRAIVERELQKRADAAGSRAEELQRERECQLQKERDCIEKMKKLGLGEKNE